MNLINNSAEQIECRFVSERHTPICNFFTIPKIATTNAIKVKVVMPHSAGSAAVTNRRFIDYTKTSLNT